MAKKFDPTKTIADKLENSFQKFFDLFFDKNKFISWIFGVFILCFFLIGCYRIVMNMLMKPCSKKG